LKSLNFYALAEEEIHVIDVLYVAGQYRHAVYHSCIAIELLLKSKLVQIDPTSAFLESHDIINIFKAVQDKYNSNKNLQPIVRFCRKYFNESRYPLSGTIIYTMEFASHFIQHVKDIKNYIDNECAATMEDLVSRFTPLE